MHHTVQSFRPHGKHYGCNLDAHAITGKCQNGANRQRRRMCASIAALHIRDLEPQSFGSGGLPFRVLRVCDVQLKFGLGRELLQEIAMGVVGPLGDVVDDAAAR